MIVYGTLAGFNGLLTRQIGLPLFHGSGCGSRQRHARPPLHFGPSTRSGNEGVHSNPGRNPIRDRDEVRQVCDNE